MNVGPLDYDSGVTEAGLQNHDWGVFAKLVKEAKGSEYPLSVFFQWDYENRHCWDCYAPRALTELIDSMSLSPYEHCCDESCISKTARAQRWGKVDQGHCCEPVGPPMMPTDLTDLTEPGSEEREYMESVERTVNDTDSILHGIYKLVYADLTRACEGRVARDEFRRGYKATEYSERGWTALRRGDATWAEVMGCSLIVAGCYIMAELNQQTRGK